MHDINTILPLSQISNSQQLFDSFFNVTAKIKRKRKT